MEQTIQKLLERLPTREAFQKYANTYYIFYRDVLQERPVRRHSQLSKKERATYGLEWLKWDQVRAAHGDSYNTYWRKDESSPEPHYLEDALEWKVTLDKWWDRYSIEPQERVWEVLVQRVLSMNEQEWETFWMEEVQPLFLLRIHHMCESDESVQARLASSYLFNQEQKEEEEEIPVAEFLQKKRPNTEAEVEIQRIQIQLLRDEPYKECLEQPPTPEQVRTLLQTHTLSFDFTVASTSEDDLLQRIAEKRAYELVGRMRKEQQIPCWLTCIQPRASNQIDKTHLLEWCEHHMKQASAVVCNAFWEMILRLSEKEWDEFFTTQTPDWFRVCLHLDLKYVSMSDEQIQQEWNEISK